MGLGDVSKAVIPKVVLVSRAGGGGSCIRRAALFLTLVMHRSESLPRSRWRRRAFCPAQAAERFARRLRVKSEAHGHRASNGIFEVRLEIEGEAHAPACAPRGSGQDGKSAFRRHRVRARRARRRRNGFSHPRFSVGSGANRCAKPRRGAGGRALKGHGLGVEKGPRSEGL